MRVSRAYEVLLFLFQVDGLAALILCSGVVVAAGNEQFKLGTYSFHRIGQITQVMLPDTESGLPPKAREWSHDCTLFCKISTSDIQIYLEIENCYIQRPTVSQYSFSLRNLEACGRAVGWGQFSKNEFSYFTRDA